MQSFLIVSPHTAEECLKTLDFLLAAGYLTHFKWACPSGEHTGYAIVEAENENEALLAVPTFVRPKARVVELVSFDTNAIKSMHNKK